MRHLFRLLICCLFVSLSYTIHAQQITVFLKDRQAFTSIKIADTGTIQLESIPETMTLVFPDDNLNYAIQFNKSKNVFKVGFNCSDSNCIRLLLSDFKDNKVTLSFEDSSLVAINERWVKPHKIIDARKKPFISLLSEKKKEEKPKQSNENPLEKTDSTGQKVMPVDVDYLKNFTLPCSEIENSCTTGNSFNFKCCVEQISSEFNKIFLYPCTTSTTDQQNHKNWKTNANAVTPKYRIVINELPGASNPITYLKYKKAKGYEYYKIKKNFSPLVGSEVAITVIGNEDTIYEIESNTVQYFLEDEQKFSGALSDFMPKKDSTTIVGSKKEKDTQKEIVQLSPEFSIDSLIAHYKSDKPFKDKLNLFAETYPDLFTKEFNEFILKQKDFVKRPVETLMDDLVETLNSSNAKNVQLKKLQEEVEKLKEEIKKYPDAYEYKNQLKAIETALIRFNNQMSSKGIMETERKNFLLCFKLYVNSHLGKAVPDNSKEFSKSLVNTAAEISPKAYYSDFSDLIKIIEFEYEKLINPKDRFAAFTKQVKVPGGNTDEITFSVKTKGGRELLLPRSYKMSLGLKIDFSTGIFVSGLTNSDFLINNEKFRYKETIETVDTLSGQVTTKYTGRVLDTINKVIRENRKLNINTGFIMHVYTRTGTPVNFGLATGPVVNDSQIQFFLGGGR